MGTREHLIAIRTTKKSEGVEVTFLFVKDRLTHLLTN